MALTPQNNDAFFREVDEEVRRDQLTDFWQRYGRTVVIAIVVGLVAFAGYLWWQHDRANRAAATGEVMAQALGDLSAGRNDAAAKALEPIAQGGTDGYRAAAALMLAATALEKGDEKGAVARYGGVAQDASVPEAFRQVALVRQTALEFDTLPPQQVIDRLKSIAVDGNPWFGSAGEMVAAAYIKLNRPADAGRLFAALAQDETVPETIRTRAVRLAGALGVDAVAGLQAAQKE